MEFRGLLGGVGGGFVGEDARGPQRSVRALQSNVQTLLCRY